MAVARILPVLAMVAIMVPGFVLADAGPTAVTCRNPVSGATWHIVIDYGRGTVDTFPAQITARRISWFDPREGGYNSMDRASGDLTTALGSSTGGWLRHNHCALGPRR